MGKLVIFSAPSGSGKTTIVRELLQRFPRLEFSVSATSRAPRGKERNGVDYFFLSPEEFRQAVQDGLLSDTTSYTITLVREVGGWRFASFDVPY